MKHVADEIRNLGLAPAIWIGATNDPNRNRFLLEHPDCILAEEAAWCGRWWLDPSHPEVVKTYIPEVFGQLLGWGYEAFKWDIIPMSLWIADQHHARFHDPTKTPEAALRDVIQAARDVIAPARYMKSCSGHADRDITFAIDHFDGGRIGGDIFTWEEYLREAVERTFRYLHFNNILFYADLDNVVIREEFNTIAQAVSRVSFNGLMGTPVTFGDHLPALQPQRVELLRRIIPVLDIHPMDLVEQEYRPGVTIVNLLVARPFEQWNVVDVFNTGDEEQTARLDLAPDLHLVTGPDAAYHVYDFWRKEYLGMHESELTLELAPFASRVLCFRRALSQPQVLSTSRHISQGGHDLLAVEWDEAACVLAGRSTVVGGETYTLAFHVPESLEPIGVESGAAAEVSSPDEHVINVSLRPADSGQTAWAVLFQRRA